MTATEMSIKTVGGFTWRTWGDVEATFRKEEDFR